VDPIKRHLIATNLQTSKAAVKCVGGLALGVPKPAKQDVAIGDLNRRDRHDVERLRRFI